MKKINNKIDSWLKRIGQHDIEKMQKPSLLILLVLIFSAVFYLQFFIFQVKNLKLGIYIPTDQERLENKVSSLVEGYPMENMISQIATKDEVVAGFLVAIAKKESNWGKRVPVLNGQDCYNYWGYRGIRDKMGSGGHTCFNSPEDAVNTVSKRLSYFIEERGLTTSEDLIVWKCGSSCKNHDSQGVRKWISDVDYYFEKMID